MINKISEEQKQMWIRMSEDARLKRERWIEEIERTGLLRAIKQHLEAEKNENKHSRKIEARIRGFLIDKPSSDLQHAKNFLKKQKQICRGGRPKTKISKELLIKFKNRGMSCREIAKELNVPKSTIARKLKEIKQ